MSMTSTRAARFAWFWCLTYTALVPREHRTRRRSEIRNHLWESGRAGTRAWATFRATCAGMADDLGWAATALTRQLSRSLVTPTPYLVLAAVLPVQAAFAYRVWPMSEDAVQGASTLAAIAFVVAGGALSLVNRHRHR